jgi:hypothetical protein
MPNASRRAWRRVLPSLSSTTGIERPNDIVADPLEFNAPREQAIRQFRCFAGERLDIVLIDDPSKATWPFESNQAMQARLLACMLALSSSPVLGSEAAGAADWEPYMIAKSGARVEIPVSLFNENAGLPEGEPGQRFYTRDRRADLTVRAIPNPENDTPAAFLAKQRPPSGIVYRRVTPEFFVVSSFRNGKIWYNRCNRSAGYMNCVLINYPASEKRQWDGIVTRISLTP